jgi:hypothetical protein
MEFEVHSICFLEQNLEEQRTNQLFTLIFITFNSHFL